MDIERIAIAELHEDPANVRKHGNRNMEAIMASLQRFEQQRPILVDGDNNIRAGNATMRAAKQLGWTEIDCVRTELTGMEAIAYAIADNRTTDMSNFDDDLLLSQLDSLEYELQGIAGYDDDELAELRKSLDDYEDEPGGSENELVETYQVIVECKNEAEQKKLFERLNGEGHKVKILQV